MEAPETSLSTFIEDDMYFLNTNSVTFLVENTLFRIPRYCLENKIPIFKALLSLPQARNGNDLEEVHEPVVLSGVTSTDFRNFLRLLVPLGFPPTTHCRDEWISVLKLSDMWDFVEGRQLAIDELTSKWTGEDIFDKIRCAKDCAVSEWLMAAYMRLVQQDASLSEDDAGQLDFSTYVKINHARESYIRACARDRYCDVGPIVNDVFREELRELRDQERHYNDGYDETHGIPVTP